MSLVVIGDCHFHNWSQFSTVLPSGRNSRLQDAVDAIKQIEEYCEHNKVSTVVQVGDIFHSRTKIDADVYVAAYTAFESLSREVDELIILVGNHDIWGATAKENSLIPFSEFALVVDEPMGYTFPVRKAKNKLVVSEHAFGVFNPFTHSVQEVVNKVPGADFGFAHQGINEATVGAFNISVKAALSVNDFPKLKYGWTLGHYHKPQDVNENVRYAGSILQNDFGERDENKSFLVWEDGIWSRIPIEGPRFVLFDSPAAYWINQIQVREQDFCRVKCTSSMAEEFQRSCPNAQIQIVNDATVKSRVSKKATENDRDLLIEYLTLMDMPTDEATVSQGLEFLGEDK